MRVFGITILVFASITLGCTSKEAADTPKSIDLIGDSKQTTYAPKPNTTGNPQVLAAALDFRTVDLYQDVVFRKRQNGWTFNTQSADGFAS